MITRKIGLLLGDEEDWPRAFEGILRRLNPSFKVGSETFHVESERIRIHPFSLRAPNAYKLVIDRLAYWYFNPREWLKKAAMLDRVYLLNNPFTFQSMEKHTAYCAMIRLGLRIPETWLIPNKRPPRGWEKKYQITAGKYNDPFDLPAIAHDIGYPLFMKPFDGGGWRGVTRITNDFELMRDYDNSGESMMHMQKSLENYDVFVRALGVGPQVHQFKYDATKPQHGRYIIESNFLSKEHQREVELITKTINAFFRWEFNSCESILKDGVLSPIDFANACPDVAVTSLHYYFPWAMKALIRWSLFCTVTDRSMKVNGDFDRYFKIADSDRSYDDKLVEYGKLADEYFETDKFNEFCATHLPHLDEVMYEFVQTKEFDDIIVWTVQFFFPPHEHERFIEHFKDQLKLWLRDQKAAK